MSGPAEVFALSGRRCHEFKISACTEKELRIRVGSIGSRRVSFNRLIIQFLRCDLLYLLSLRIQACEFVSRNSKPLCSHERGQDSLGPGAVCRTQAHTVGLAKARVADRTRSPARPVCQSAHKTGSDAISMTWPYPPEDVEVSATAWISEQHRERRRAFSPSKCQRSADLDRVRASAVAGSRSGKRAIVACRSSSQTSVRSGDCAARPVIDAHNRAGAKERQLVSLRER